MTGGPENLRERPPRWILCMLLLWHLDLDCMRDVVVLSSWIILHSSPAACANLLRAVEVHYYAQLTILDVANISGRYLSGAVPCRKAREYLLKGNSAETSPIAMI